MSSLPFPPLSRSSCSSSFISQRSSHSHVRVAGLFLSPSQPRPTGSPLRPWSSTKPSLFLLLQSLISFSFVRSSSTSVSLLPPPPSLLQASSSSAPVTLSEFLENIEEGFPRNFLGSVPPWLSDESVYTFQRPRRRGSPPLLVLGSWISRPSVEKPPEIRYHTFYHRVGGWVHFDDHNSGNDNPLEARKLLARYIF